MIANHSLAKFTIILRFFWILFAGEIKFLLKYFDFFEKIAKTSKKIPAKNVFRFDFKIDGGKSGKIDWKNEIIVIVYDRRSFMSDWRSYFWEFKMNDRGSYFYNVRAHDREWSWLMKKMIIPINADSTWLLSTKIDIGPSDALLIWC